ncbi:hypothetical protein NDU88_004147 [Pleurodeles waltl]|uniref:Uncharacterized protein n=1 Tax=Pleurodeles waltl TaxID=8319 RepID=A0AAV7SHZ0_PLEWA|nr:hypothetical protein NDU88_004147 [Pleurodeles waltl]
MVRAAVISEIREPSHPENLATLTAHASPKAHSPQGTSLAPMMLTKEDLLEGLATLRRELKEDLKNKLDKGLRSLRYNLDPNLESLSMDLDLLGTKAKKMESKMESYNTSDRVTVQELEKLTAAAETALNRCEEMENCT